MPAQFRRGQPPKYVKGLDGKPIVGLSFDKGTHQYFYTHWRSEGIGKRPTFGTDYTMAIMLFRAWQAEREGESFGEASKLDYQKSLSAVGTVEITDEFAEAMEKYGVPLSAIIEAIKLDNVKVPDSYALSRVRELFAKHTPSQMAEKLGIPGIAKLDIKLDDSPQITLTQVLDDYNSQPRFEGILSIQQKLELKKVKSSWDLFLRITGCRTIGDVDKNSVRRFYDQIYRQYLKEDMSTSWLNGYLERVKRLFNFALRQYDDIAPCRDALAVCKAVLVKVKDEVKTPAKLIKPGEIQQILEVSTIEERAMWYLSLNCAFYKIDIATLPKTSLDFTTKTCVFRRGKTGEHRSAVLWSETILAIQAYWNEYNHKGATVFLCKQTKAPYYSDRVYKKFITCLKKTNIQRKLTHSNFRDSTHTVCQIKHVPDAAISSLMGHKLKGVGSNYTDPETFPEIAEPACQVVHDYYFVKADSERSV